MQPFAAGLLREPQVAAPLLQRIEYWTKGHPYLTQKLCQAVANDATVMNAAGVDRVCESLFLDSRSRDTENNLQHVRTMLLQGKSEEDQAAILDLYRQVRRTKRVKDDDTNPIINVLRLSGLVKVWENYLWVRNHIYFRVFDEAWITANLPDAEQQRQRAAQRRGFLRGLGMSAVVVAVMAGLTLWAVGAQREATRQEAIAIKQKNLALQAINTLTYDQIKKLLAEAPNARRSILAIFQSNIKTLEAIYALAPEDSKAQREKSVNLNNIGNTWLVLGNTKEALQAYEQSLEIDKRLATADPQNAQAQRDLSVSYEKLGNVQLQLGNTKEALQD
jgi:tetratricopeptide (TPR) repeat protein